MSAEMPDTVRPDLPSLGSMQDKLDALWEKHLVLLDQYDQAQKQLQKHMSSGFFSLAEASFKSPSRIRYGQDYYDERMQAARKCHVHMESDNQSTVSLRFSDQSDVDRSGGESKAKDATKEGRPAADDDEKREQLPTPPATPLHETAVPGNEADEEHKLKVNGEAAPEFQEDRSKKPTDPLHWYGILVPQQLRQSQRSFIAAVEGPLGDAANAAQGMRRIDVEIRKLRKHIRKAERKGVLVERNNETL